MRDNSTTLASLLVARAGDDHAGYVFEDESYTWADVVDNSAQRAALIGEMIDPTRPPHVGVLLDNVPEYLFLVGGAALAGAAVVGVNPTRRGAELARDIAHTDCQVLITSSTHAEIVPGDLDVPVLLVDSPEYEARLATHGNAALPETLPAPDTDLFLMFTSGSTSAPKAVTCSNGRAGSAGVRVTAGYGIGRDDVCYCQMPLFHGNALLACFAPAVACGATVVLRRRFSASGFIDDVRRYGCTYFTYVGRSISYILAQPPSPSDKDHDLRLAFGTEASVADRAAFADRFGVKLTEGYGSSESAVVIVRTPDTPPDALGRPRPGEGSDVAVVDNSTGAECPRAVFDGGGQLLNGDVAIGEIVNRSGGVGFEGYYNNPEATEQRLRNGWFWSGDLGYVDGDGFFYFAGRTDDWLRVDSENFAAAPVEQILTRFPGVAAVAVYALPDPVTGDLVAAAFEMADDAVFDGPTFGDFLSSQPDLGTKWAPRFVRIINEMPVTANNKINKRPLREDGTDTDDTVWLRTGSELVYVRRT